MGIDVKTLKQMLRERIWRLLEERDVADFPRPVYGRIPNFKGADKAAYLLATLEIWKKSKVIKSNPDSPQFHVRYRALVEGKKVVMASPRLKEGFILLDPSSIPPRALREAATIRGAFRYGRTIRLCEIPPIDLVIVGSVAVDNEGRRVGKGGGYSELEYAILRELGKVDESTPIVTTIHDFQLVDNVPVESHDLTVDYVITPTRIIEIRERGARPSGIMWEKLGGKKDLKIFEELRKCLEETT